jgi:hypothetical protein
MSGIGYLISPFTNTIRTRERPHNFTLGFEGLEGYLPMQGPPHQRQSLR